MPLDICFLPIPKQLIPKPGFFEQKPGGFVQINHSHPQRLLFAAEQIKAIFTTHLRWPYQLTASSSVPEGLIAVQLKIDPEILTKPQAYHLSITPNRISITGSDEAGVFYGVGTLRQIVAQTGDHPLPCLEIEDWPDFLARGVMLDISRDKVYRMETLLMLVDEFASWKINQLQLYTEHTFAYAGHEMVWRDASPITPEEILILDRYCQERYIELVPNQNSLGHLTRWLKHPLYQHLAESTEPVANPWGGLQIEPYSLSPVLPESLAFITSLYDQLLPNFSSKMVNVGCDETFDIGAGKSKAAVAQLGQGKVYLDFLIALYQDVKRRGYTMQFWGDIVLEHPELIPHLPTDAIALNWGYEGDHPFEAETKAFRKAGVPFYVCPGTSSWNSIAGRTQNMLNNIRNAAYFGLENSALGCLTTDWGDNGHWQQLPISYPGFAAGASLAWNTDAALNPTNLADSLNRVAFLDKSENIGQLLLDIGDLYQAWGLNLPNSSPLFWLLQLDNDQVTPYLPGNPTQIEVSLGFLEAAEHKLPQLELQRPDADLIIDELALTIKLLQHACKRAKIIQDAEKIPNSELMLREIDDIKTRFAAIWLRRNRPGGLPDSLSRFDTLIKAYESDCGTN
ncbi:MAG: family 20 glycosylhydrolase [Brevefilum sp.]|nr:family 20 glycosylhydrolase [Brevefilum sp.]